MVKLPHEYEKSLDIRAGSRHKFEQVWKSWIGWSYSWSRLIYNHGMMLIDSLFFFFLVFFFFFFFFYIQLLLIMSPRWLYYKWNGFLLLNVLCSYMNLILCTMIFLCKFNIHLLVKNMVYEGTLQVELHHEEHRGGCHALRTQSSSCHWIHPETLENRTYIRTMGSSMQPRLLLY